MIETVQNFDRAIVGLLNSFVGHWHEFDLFIAWLDANFVGGTVFLAGIFWFWCYRDNRQVDRQRVIINMVPAVFIALVINRTIAVWLPFRARPMHDPALAIRVVQDAPRLNLESWSSFPSDTASYFFVMVAAFWLMSRKAGVFYGIYAVTLVLLLRIYLGIHYPSDIVAGAAIGIITMVLTDRLLDGSLTRRLRPYIATYPHWFAALGFLVAYELAVMLADIRDLQHGMLVRAHREVQAWIGSASWTNLLLVGAPLLLAIGAAAAFRWQRTKAPSSRAGKWLSAILQARQRS
jgi:undecaprenyl-diphosphatase